MIISIYKEKCQTVFLVLNRYRLKWKSGSVGCLSHVQLFVTPWTVACQASLSMEFSRQEYWSGLPFPSLGDLLDPGIEPESPALQSDSLLSEPQGKPSHSVVSNSFWLHGLYVACQAFLSFIPPDIAQTHVHWVSDAIQPAHPLLPPSPPALNL